jgi:hypothetical protein
MSKRTLKPLLHASIKGAIAGLCLSGYALAEERVLEEVIVTGTKRAVAQSPFPRSLRMISPERLAMISERLVIFRQT